MKKRLLVIAALLLFSVLLLSACNGNNQAENQSENNNRSIQQLGITQDDVRIPLASMGGQAYFPLDELLKVIGYHMELAVDNPNQILIGDIDVFYTMNLQSAVAEKEEEPVNLPIAPRLLNDKIYAPVAALDLLFDQDVHYQLEEGTLRVHATGNDDFSMDDMEAEVDQPVTTGEPFFQDDPDDPFRGEEKDQHVWRSFDEQDEESISASRRLDNINMNALIRTAKRYMGVPYKFGAKPYPVSKKFDCSSYTQYIFGKYGIDLRRVSRNQAKQGHTVSRKKLRKGDLVFFSVPGRFKSDKTVGHVGIYIGNGKMINTFSDKKGVHITNVNRGYWSSKFLKAKRVAY